MKTRCLILISAMLLVGSCASQPEWINLFDGESLKDLDLYRAESPPFIFGPLPENNVLDVEPGTVAGSVSDGYYILLAPLSVGEHEIHFGGAAVFTLEEDGFDFFFGLDITYNITVE